MSDQVLNALGLAITGIVPLAGGWWIWCITGGSRRKGRKR